MAWQPIKCSVPRELNKILGTEGFHREEYKFVTYLSTILASSAGKMALRHAALPELLFSITSLSTSRTALRLDTRGALMEGLQQSHSFRPTIALPFALYSSLSSIWSQLWDSILRAVPKKKTSHRKKRQRFLAGKALKDVTNLNTCSACGNVKRAHLLCPYCVEGDHQPGLI